MIKGHGHLGNPLKGDDYSQNHHLEGDVFVQKFPYREDMTAGRGN